MFGVEHFSLLISIFLTTDQPGVDGVCYQYLYTPYVLSQEPSILAEFLSLDVHMSTISIQVS